MKKIYIAAVAALCIAMVVILFAGTAFATMEDAGLVIPREAGVEEQIAGAGEDIPLHQLNTGDVVYQSLAGFYVGNQRTHIDLGYPMYMNDGAVLRFWNEGAWLLTLDMEMYPTFEGMYLSEGTSYNPDYSQADDREFILVSLGNGLYMNAQKLLFQGPLETVNLPANAILRMTEDSFRWYVLRDGVLQFGEVDAVFGARITFGTHTFRYRDMLEALGMIQEAEEAGEAPEADPTLQEEAAQMLHSGTRPNRQNTTTPHAVGSGDGGEGDEQEEAEKKDSDTYKDKPDKPAQEPEDGEGEGDGTTGGGGGGGTSSGNNNDSGTNAGVAAPGDEEEGDGVTGGVPGEPIIMPYSKPTITIGNLEAWCYAVGVDLKIEDLGSSLYQGVSFSVYGDLEAVDGAKPADGSQKEYKGEDYKGKSPMLRASKNSSQSFALATLPPNRTVYIQYTYRYTDYLRDADENIQYKKNPDGTFAKDKNGKYIPLIKREQVRSNFYTVKTLSIDKGNVQPVASNWTEAFATMPNGIELNGLTLKNTSSYVSDLKKFNFENFKLNTLPYVSRYEITLEPRNNFLAPTQTLVVGGNELRSAQISSAGTTFQSMKPPLESNTKYRYTVKALDPYGNEIPLIANGDADFEGLIYTQKATPTVSVDIQSNTTDNLVLKVKVSDPDGALEGGGPLRFGMNLKTNQTTGSGAELDAEWDKTEDISRQDDYTLLLMNPKNNKSYTFELSGLAFASWYDVLVHGDLNLQPKDVEDPALKLEPEDDVLLASTQIYTAKLVAGQVAFGSDASDITDTSATIQFLMNRESTMELLPWVDEFRIRIKDPDGNEMTDLTTILSIKDLDVEGMFQYQSSTKSILLQEGTSTKPEITLTGERDSVWGTSNPWESFLLHQVQGEPNEDGTPGPLEYTVPMTLNIKLPAGSLECNSRYSYSIEAVVHNGGQETKIQTKQTSSYFTTRKASAQVKIDDIFLAADVAQLIDVRVIDPDGAIQSGGAVKVYLYQGTTLLKVDNLTANAEDDPNAEPVHLKYTDLTPSNQPIPGEDPPPDVEYTILFVADMYNDGSGFESEKTIHTITFKADNQDYGLFGSLNLTALGQETGKTTFQATVDINIKDPKGYLLKSTQGAQVIMEIARSDLMEYPQYPKDLESLEDLGDLEELKDPQDLGNMKDTEYLKYFRLTPTGPEEDGSYQYIQEDGLLKGLKMDDAYRIRLMTEYRGSIIYLDEINFRTDTTYVAVSTHWELVQAQMKNITANILITGDFELDPTVNKISGVGSDRYVNLFRGNIDFQGHKVIRPVGYSYYFLDIGRGGRVTNMVYEYPAVALTEMRSSAVIYRNYGEVENFIVITQGQVNINDACGLVMYSQAGRGSTRNLIVRLGGDLVINGTNTGALYGAGCGGLLENGYIYSNNNSGLIARVSSARGLFSGFGSHATFRNFFAAIDYFYENGVVGTPALHTNQSANDGRRQNMYFVSDYYSIREDAVKNYDTLSTHQRAITTNNTSMVSNAWAITNNSYLNSYTATVSMAPTDILYDLEWQRSVLGDGFDVDNTVPLGYYPRLILPECMRQYQEYIRLPGRVEGEKLQIVSDSWAPSTSDVPSHGNDWGNIVLSFKNEKGTNRQVAELTDIEIEGLDVKIGKQGYNGDLFQVTLQVEVPDTADGKYVSAYKVKSFAYKMGSRNIKEPTPNYTTKNIEFWKEIYGTDQWARMNDNMGWNYKLMNDLDFTGLRGDQFRIAGYGGKTIFTGKLDGQEHVLKNMKSLGSPTPYVFYQVGTDSPVNDGEIRNLFVDNLTLTSNGGTTVDYMGFVRRIFYGTLSNIRIRNSTMRGQASVGFVAGRVRSAVVENCAVIDSTLEDVMSNSSLQMGGLVGNIYQSSIRSSYVRNLDINVTRSPKITGVGGVLGWQENGVIWSCYAQGKINIMGSFAGGLVGRGGSSIYTSWTYMDIYQTYGIGAGGIAGHDNYGNSMGSGVVLGNISSTADKENVDPVGVKVADNYLVYLSDSQQVSNWTEKDDYEKGNFTRFKDDNVVRVALSSLYIPDYWSTTIKLGEAYDFSTVIPAPDPIVDPEGLRRCAPLLRTDTKKSGWTQQSIYLPGVVEKPALTILDNEVENDRKTFHLQVRLKHPGVLSTPEFWEELREGFVLDGVEYEGFFLDGISYDPKTLIAQADPRDDQATILTLDTSGGYTKAMDSYPLTVSYDPGNGFPETIQIMVPFLLGGKQQIFYWEVSTWDQWERLMKDHWNTNENFKIMQMIPVPENATITSALAVNRLEGDTEDETVDPGFSGMRFDAGTTGNAWFDKVTTNLQGIHFEDMEFDFQKTSADRPISGPFLYLFNVSDVELDEITMTVKRNNRKKVGFFADVGGDINGVNMDHVTLNYTDTVFQDSRNYAGALCSNCEGTANDVTATNITVNMPSTTYVGAIFGRLGGGLAEIKAERLSLDTFSVTGRAGVAGMMGYYERNGHYWTVQNGTVTAKAGSASGVASTRTNNTDDKYMSYNVVVRNLDISATANASGISSSGRQFSKSLVDNCNIFGYGYVGGICASSGHFSLCDVRVTNSTIRCGYNANTKLTAVGAGGLVGVNDNYRIRIKNAVVQNCHIEGPANVGGALGLKLRGDQSSYSNVYIGTDVTIEARSYANAEGGTVGGINAGGIIGSIANLEKVENCAVGATITARENAGGIIGVHNLHGEKPKLTGSITKSYYRGTITATNNYAAGIVGRINASNLNITNSYVNKCLVAAEIICPGVANAWINDNSSGNRPGTAGIDVWEGTLLQGRMIKDILAEAPIGEGINSNAVPVMNNAYRSIPTENLASATYYTQTLGLNPVAVDHMNTEGNPYMPYTVNYYADDEGNTVVAAVDGVPYENYRMTFPEGLPMAVTYVYPASINTILIERHYPQKIESLEEIWYSTDSSSSQKNVKMNKVDDFTAYAYVPISGNLTRSLTLGQKTYDNLTRRVMAWGNYWFFLDAAGALHYGGDTGELGKLHDGPFIHLWEGQAITATGETYTIAPPAAPEPDPNAPDGEAGGESGGASGGDLPDLVLTQQASTPQPAAQPIFNYPAKNAEVYGGFTKDTKNNTFVPYQVHYLGSDSYVLSNSLLAQKDGIFLKDVVNNGVTKRYFSFLRDKNQGGDGSIFDGLTRIDTSTLTKDATTGKFTFQYMSNSKSYYGNCVAFWNGNGDIQVLNLATGMRVYPAMNTRMRFMSFARGVLRGLVGELVDGSAFGGTEGEEIPSEFTGIAEPEGTGEGSDTATEAANLDAWEETRPDGTVSGSGEGSGDGEGEGENGHGQTGTAEGEGGGSGGDGSPSRGGGLHDSSGLLGDRVTLFSPDAGRFVVAEAASVSENGTRKQEQQPVEAKEPDEPKEPEEALPEPEESEPSGDFQVAQNMGLTLYSSEKQGFLLIGLAAAAAVLGLLLMVMVILRKHNSKDK